MTNDTTLDARTRELIAIGASIAGNCLPCLRYHFAEAIKAGCSLEEIQQAVELSKMVKQRPIDDIDKLATDLVERERQGATRT
jgi:AhpD family alkylhydroperoxidase